MKEIRTEDRIDEAVLLAPNTPIAANHSGDENLDAHENARKGRNDLGHQANPENYRED